MDDIDFEWDESKNLSNQKKHGVSFEDAASVFSDPRMLMDMKTGRAMARSSGSLK
jgi:uncharacterized protein